MKSRIHKYHNRETGGEETGIEVKTKFGWAHLMYPKSTNKGFFISKDPEILKRRRESLKSQTEDDFELIGNSQINLAIPKEK